MDISLFGCKIKLSFSFIAFIVALTFIDKSLLFLLGVFAALIHEVGHLICIKSRGYVIKEINIDLFNISIVDHNIVKKDYLEDVMILIYGPLFNLISFVIFFILYNFLQYKILLCFSLENLFLALFNLLPVYSLDGGQILSILLNRKTGEKRADKILNVISLVTVFPIAVIGFYILLVSRYNFSLLFVSLYLIVVLMFKNKLVFK